MGIEGNVDVKTTDGYTIRIFCIGFTRKQEMSTKKTCYAQAQQIRNIRKKMIDVITREVSPPTSRMLSTSSFLTPSLAMLRRPARAPVRSGQADGHARRGQW